MANIPKIQSAHNSEARNIINTLIERFNNMGYTYDQAMAMAQNVLDEAEKVNTENTNTNERLDNIIADSGTSSTEVVDARGTFTVLSERLEAEKIKLENAEKKSQNALISNIENIKPLQIRTFDGSYEPYHPSVKYFSEAWNGFKYWMVYTPFPSTSHIYKDRWECPSIAVSHDGINWREPVAGINPLVDLTPGEISNRDYYSDPDIVMNGSTMEIWYRRTNGANLSQTDIYRITSTNGVDWSQPEMVLDSQDPENGVGGVDNTFRSHQVFYDGATYRAYSGGHSGGELWFAETDYPGSGRWTNFTQCNFDNKPPGSSLWHVGINFIDGVYHTLVHSRVTEQIIYYTSSNGVDFEYQGTLLNVTSTITAWYQSYPIKVENRWLAYVGITKNGKNGITLFEGDDLLNLIPVDNPLETKEKAFMGDVTLANSSDRSTNVNQLIFSPLKDGEGRYGYGADLNNKHPRYIWIDDKYNSSLVIPTVQFGLISSNPTPMHIGQILIDGSNTYISNANSQWVRIAGVEPTITAADSHIDTKGAEILRLNSVNNTTIQTLVGGSIYQELIIWNQTPEDLTLKHAFVNNGIATQNKQDYTILSGTSVKLFATIRNGLPHWHII